jgi:hypothetical protein
MNFYGEIMKNQFSFIFVITLLAGIGSYTQVAQAKDANPKVKSQVESNFQQRVNRLEFLIKELSPMDLESFKKRVPSLSEYDKALFLDAIIDSQFELYLTKEKFCELKNIDEREKFLFLALEKPKTFGSILYWAYKNNDQEAKLLLKKVGYLPSSALKYAAWKKDIKTINALLKEGVEIDSDTIAYLLSGSRLLEQKNYHKIKKILKVMLPRVKNINQPAATFFSPRSILYYAPNAEIARMLLHAGVKINNEIDQDLLSDQVKHLFDLQREAEKAKDPESWIDSSRVESLIEGYIALIKLFIKYGADPSIVGKYGKSAIELAEEACLGDLIPILKRANKK